jgi:hypothetical protein
MERNFEPANNVERVRGDLNAFSMNFHFAFRAAGAGLRLWRPRIRKSAMRTVFLPTPARFRGLSG